MTKLSYFKNIDNSSKPRGTMSLEECLQYIKDNASKSEIVNARTHPTLGGKGNKLKKHTDIIYQGGKQVKVNRNLYEHVKFTKVKMVTWALGEFSGRRRKADITSENLSGYMYLDIDDYSTIINSEEFEPSNESEAISYVRSILTSNTYPFIKAAWRSFGGRGYGFLVKCEDLSIENYKATWKTLNTLFNRKGIELDSQTKDYTRSNVLSYDPNIFIRDDEDVEAFQASEVESSIATEKINLNSCPSNIALEIVQTRLTELYNSASSWDGGDNRLNYSFYQRYFSYCNLDGIDLDVAYQALIDNKEKFNALFEYRSNDEVYRIGSGQYSTYADQFSQFSIPLKEAKTYEVESIYNEYGGDVDLKIAYEWYNATSYGNITEANVKKFAKSVKLCGILQSEVLSFIDKLDLDEYESAIRSVYNDRKVLYGVDYKYSASYINLRKNNLKEFLENQGYTVYLRDEYRGNIGRKCTTLAENAIANAGGFEYDMLFKLFQMYYASCKKFAIGASNAKEVLNNVFEEKSINHAEFEKIHTFVCNEVYSNEQWKFGVNWVKEISPEDYKSLFEFETEYKLEAGVEYLSNLNLKPKLGDKLFIWANTGAGKTTWICKHLKGHRLILVPTVALLQGIFKEYNASVFFRDSKTVSQGDELIVCTYSSFPKLLSIMEGWEDTKISEYDVYFDEEHNNATSSDKLYRGRELNCIVDNIDLFRSFTYVTGTKFPILSPKFDEFRMIRVDWKEIPSKRFKRVRYNNQITSLEKRLSRGKKNIIFLQNKKEEGDLGALLEYLEVKGWDKNNIALINADTKNSLHFRNLINNEKIDEHLEIIICTSVVVEGINIKNTDVASVHFMSKAGLVDMEQMVNRLRKIYINSQHNCMIYIYDKIKDEVDEESDVDVYGLQLGLIENAKEALKIFSVGYTVDDTNQRKNAMRIMQNQMFEKSKLFRNVDGRWVVDYLSIANMAYHRETIYANKNIKYMSKILSIYGWEFMGDELDREDMNTDIKTHIRNLKIERKEMLKDVCMSILHDIRIDGEDKCIADLEDDNISDLELLDYPEWQIGLRSKIKSLCRNMEFTWACNLVQQWVLEHNMSDRIWTKINRQLQVAIGRKLGNFSRKYDTSNEFLTSIMKYYKSYMSKLEQDDKHTISKRDIHKALKKRKKYCEIIEKFAVDYNTSFEIFKQHFDIVPVLINGEVRYRILGCNIQDSVSKFAVDFNDLGVKYQSNGIQFTTDEITREVNKIAKRTPIFGMNTLNKSKAMQLCRDYFTVERDGSRTVGGRRIALYRISSLFAEEILNIPLMPNRKDKGKVEHFNYIFDYIPQ